MLFIKAVQLTVSLWLGVCPAESQKAFKVIDYDKETAKFTVNEEGVENIASLAAPLYVISALGDARIGKSTAFNHVISKWTDGQQPRRYQEYFSTGEKALSCKKKILMDKSKRVRHSLLQLHCLF